MRQGEPHLPGLTRTAAGSGMGENSNQFFGLGPPSGDEAENLSQAPPDGVVCTRSQSGQPDQGYEDSFHRTRAGVRHLRAQAQRRRLQVREASEYLGIRAHCSCAVGAGLTQHRIGRLTVPGQKIPPPGHEPAPVDELESHSSQDR